MKSWILLCASLLLPLAAGALDLTPFPATRELEGAKIPILQFRDGTRWINYQPPPNWTSSGGKSELRFAPPEVKEAALQFSIFALPRKPDGAPETVEEQLKWVRTLLPKESAEAEVVSTNANPFTLEGKPCREWVFRFRRGNRDYCQSIALVDLNEKQRFVFALTALSGDFEALRNEAVASLFSWQPAD